MRRFLATPFFVLALFSVMMLYIILGSKECNRIISEWENRKD